MSGGPNTIFHVTAPLAREGHRIRYVATIRPAEPDIELLRDHVRSLAMPGVAELLDFQDASSPGASLPIGAGDVVIATWWSTAYIAEATLPLTRAQEFVYLIQDFEPGFYPWSTKYALAAATYAMPFRAVINEPMLLEHLRLERVGRFADPAFDPIVFMPSVDREIFAHRSIPTDTVRRLAFYARPKHARNLFDLGLAVLRRAAEQGVFNGADWEFYAVGETVPELPIDDTNILRPMPWLDYAAYGAFLGQADVLLALMLSPHTSYPPLEMAATGGQVVTNTFGGKTREGLSRISPAIHAGPANVNSLVTELRDAVLSAMGDRREPNVDLPGSWDEAMRVVTPRLAATVDELRGTE